MDIKDLQNEFSVVSDTFALTVQAYLASCPCDENTKAALDEIARQAHHAITQTQNALIDYLETR